MTTSDLRVRALELAIESAGHPTRAEHLVATAELFLDFLAGKQPDAVTVNIHSTTLDPAETAREIKKAIAAARRTDGGSA